MKLLIQQFVVAIKSGGDSMILEVKELDMAKNEDIEKLAMCLGSGKWTYITSYYKNTNLKPLVFVIGRTK